MMNGLYSLGRQHPPLDLVVIDPLAEDRGHLLEDELFWVASLSDKAASFRLVSSSSSIERCATKWPLLDAIAHCDSIPGLAPRQWQGHMRYLNRMGVRVPKNCKVLLQSFHELSALWFAVRNPTSELYLIVTNNLTGDGVKTPRRLFIQRQIFKRAAGVFVGSNFELQLLRERGDVPPGRLHKMRYHKLGAKYEIIPLARRRKEVAFLGNPTRARGLGTFIKWAQSCRDTEYDFRIYGQFSSRSEERQYLGEGVTNLTLFDRFLSDGEYHNVIANASFVALPFESALEGRLSGVLCDAIAHGTPVIASKQEPHLDLFRSYGEFGYLIDGVRDALNPYLLPHVTLDCWGMWQTSMKRVRDDNSPAKIAEQVLGVMFGRPEF